MTRSGRMIVILACALAVILVGLPFVPNVPDEWLSIWMYLTFPGGSMASGGAWALAFLGYGSAST